jgi:predicted NAD/FAD-binding protein
MGSFDYAHPVFDGAAIRAQKDLPALQGKQHTYFCGAWTGYGFHEDGLKSGLLAAELISDINEPAFVAPPPLLANTEWRKA